MKQEESVRTSAGASAPLAIIGIGCLFPQAVDTTSYWANIREGLDAITDIPATHWNPADYFDQNPATPDMTYGRRGGFLAPVKFNPMEYNIPPATLEAIDTSQLLGLVAAGQALRDAGYGPGREFDRNRVSVILGVTGTLELVIPLGARLGHPHWKQALKDAGVDDITATDVIQRISDSYVPWQENSFPGLLGNVVAGRISKNFDLGGTNCVVDAACASSLSALHLAGMELATGKSDMVVTGGIDTFNDIFMYMCFSKTPALSPTGNAKPFDASGDGTILGEGLGLVVIKRLEDAERDGDRIYAVIRGIGSSSDGKGEAIYTPSAAGQKKAIIDAYQRAGVTPDSIGLVEAHGTGTKVGDAVEVSALRDIYGEADTPWCALGSVKSQIGHTKAAAGAAGLIKAAMALHHRVIPPTIKVKQPLKEVSDGQTPFYLADKKRPWLTSGTAPRRAAVSALGFGGSNFHMVLEEYQPTPAAADWDGNIQILPFSAQDSTSLDAALAGFSTDQSWDQLRSLAAEARTAFDSTAACRLVLVVNRSQNNLATLLTSARTMLAKSPDTAWNTPDGIFYAAGPASGDLALLFPGQGAQYPGMLRDLACAFPEMIDTLQTADSGFDPRNGKRLSDLIYPPADFTPDSASRQEEELRATDVAQPAIGAVSLGALKLLNTFGITPSAAAGHSYGELTALCAAGRLSEESFHALSRLRGELMAAGDGDKGTMLAISAPIADVGRMLEEEKLDLVLANCNAPSQAVLSGRSDEIARAIQSCKSRKLTCKQLQVGAAFHSQLVADAAKPLLKALKNMSLAEGTIPVFSNSTAAEYPAAEHAARELLANQLARPVEFVSQIESMHVAGVRTFVEVGPGARLTGLVKAILGDHKHAAVALDSSNGKRSGMIDLARCLSQIAVLGHTIDLTAWDNTFQPLPAGSKKALMTVDICGANYVKPRDKRPPTPPRQVTVPTTPAHQTGTSTAATPSTVSAASTDALAESLRVTREGMAVLQRMQEETAQLHRRFLEGQETASRTIQTLLDQQQRILQGGVVANSVPLHASSQPSLSTTPHASHQQQVSPATPQTPINAIMETLLAVVAEKTGYPVEMLEPSMGMDSDLGIDSIKRVEILSALQEKLPAAPIIGPEQLGTLNTLGDIAAYLGAGAATFFAAPLATPSAVQGTVSSAPASAIMETLLAVVAEKTGYPVEMLEPSMGMDSDLGIDSIKRVEILSALQEKLPGSPVIGPEQLGTLNTLGDIAVYLGAGATTIAATVPAAATELGTIMETLLAVVAEKTGYPVEMLEPSMGMDSDLGIDSIKRVEILSALQEKLPAAPIIGPEQLGTLNTLGDIAAYLGAGAQTSEMPPASQQAQTSSAAHVTPVPPAALHAHDDTPLTRSTIVPVPLPVSGESLKLAPNGIIWVSDDGSSLTGELCSLLKQRGLTPRIVQPDSVIPCDEAVSGLVLIAPQAGCDDAFLADAFMLLKQAAPALQKAAGETGSFLATVSRLNGQFGCDVSSTISDPLSGGLAGMAKTASHEWSQVTCKAIDLGTYGDTATAATALASELLTSGPLEIGLSPAGRITLELVQLPAIDTVDTAPLSPGDLVLVTGGGRGVTAAAAIELAKAYQPLLVLLGRSAAPSAEPSWLNGLEDESAIKRAIMANSPEKLHPRQVEERYQAILAGRELNATMAAIAATGTTALYRPVDIRDTAALSTLVDELRRSYGPVRGIIHGAGVLADRLIVDKTREQFELVYGTKIEGLRSLLAATTGDDLRCLALFGSTTGRFGRTGQVDYAVANEVLNKMAQSEARRRSGCRTVCINWGPWDGGMVTPSLKKVFSSEGIGLIPLQAGGRLLTAEIAAQGAPVETIVLAGAPQPPASLAPVPDRQLSEALSLTLSIDDYPFINSHVMNGKAVLPMAVIVEWLAQGALHGNPGFRFHGFNSLRICKGVTFSQSETRPLKIMAGKAEKVDSLFIVPVELVSATSTGRQELHARADIVLASRLPEGIRSIVDLPASPYTGGTVYDGKHLFHGPALHGIEQITSCSPKGITALIKPAPAPSEWIKQPLRTAWLTDPLVVDCAFQMMILWSFDHSGSGSLPSFAGRYRQFQESFPREGAQVVIRVASVTAHSATADIEFLERTSGKLIARLEGYECVIDPSLMAAFSRNQLPNAESVALEAA